MPQFSLRTVVTNAAAAVARAHGAFVGFVGLHPILLIPLSIAYAFLTLITGVIAVGLAIGLKVAKAEIPVFL